jgi:hypothetical protein
MATWRFSGWNWTSEQVSILGTSKQSQETIMYSAAILQRSHSPALKNICRLLVLTYKYAVTAETICREFLKEQTDVGHWNLEAT